MNVLAFFLLWSWLMPAPTNISAETATDLGALPATVTQDVNDSGTTYTVWYSFTATQTGVVGIWGSGLIGGAPGTYAVVTSPFIGPASSPVAWPDQGITAVSTTNRPIQIPVTSGVTYYLSCDSFYNNVSPANLTLTAEYFTQTTAAVGSIGIPDDAAGFPLALLSPTTGTVRQFVLDFPPGEMGVSEPSIGAVLVDDNVNLRFTLYTSTLSQVTTLAHAGATGTSASPDLAISFGRTNDCFYAAWTTSGGAMTLKRLSPSDLTVQQTWTATSVTKIRAIAPNQAETKLYLAGKAGLTGSAISMFDLGTGTFGADFAATIANYTVCDILVLPDDTVVVLYQKNSATRDLLLKTYDSGGSVLQSLSYGSAISSAAASRLTYTLADDSVSFWLWIHNSDETGTFKTVKASDLSDLVSFSTNDYEDGGYQAAQAADPVRFGNSQSCPFFVLRGAAPTITTYPIRRQRRFLLPSSPDNKMLFLHYLELLMRTGIGNSAAPDPQVMLRISRDGGKTWSDEFWRSAGAVGEWQNRVRWLRLGRYRNAVVELTVSDPVDWQFLSTMGTVAEGDS